MKLKPILFSTEMVRAILDDGKTMTRRPIKTDVNFIQWQPIVLNGYGGFCDEHGNPVKCKYDIGDILWVRETWQQECEWIKFKDASWADAYLNATGKYVYKADGVSLEEIKDTAFGKWKPSIHMPYEACRLWLKVTDVRVERVQDITEEDAKAEGYASDGDESARIWFSMLWDRTYPASWERNEWVFVTTFEKTEKPKDK